MERRERERTAAAGLGWAEYLRQWEIHLRARGLARTTIAWYLTLASEAATRLSALGLPDDPTVITRGAYRGGTGLAAGGPRP